MRAPPMPGRIHTVPGDPPIEVELRRSTRARRLTLRVSRSDGRVRLSLPDRADEAEALAFLAAREGWMRRHLAAAPAPRRPRIGGTVPVGGVERPIVAGTGRAARFSDGALHVPEDDRLAPRLAALLKALARDRLAEASHRHAAALGRPVGRITLRDPRSRWGSCSTRGDLMFSWRLIMAPPEVLEYVAAHEAAHLVEMNHSARFWALCETLFPGHAGPRDWLKRNGAGLLAWRFDGLP